METDYHAIGVRLIPKLHLNKVYYHSDIDSSYRITYINELAIFDNEGNMYSLDDESSLFFYLNQSAPQFRVCVYPILMNGAETPSLSPTVT